jgi:hypothetical protein
MSEYDNTNKGSLFKNDKGDNPKRPDYQGKINIDGTEYRLSAWVQTPKKGGAKYMALKVSEPNTSSPATKPVPDLDNDQDEIPF